MKSFRSQLDAKRAKEKQSSVSKVIETNEGLPAEKESSNMEEKINPIALREVKNIVGGGGLEKISVDLIDLSPYQPRIITNKVLDSLIPLAKDIERNGQLNPITVRQKGQRYELIGGERRFRAIKEILELDYITAIVKANVSDEKAAIQAFSDNMNREDLSDYENITQIKQICDEFGFPFDNAEFVTEKFSIDKSKYFRLKYILELPVFILDDLSIEPDLVSGYIAQELKIEINKQLETKPEAEIYDLLRQTWAKYVKEYKGTGKRNKSFVTALSGNPIESNLSTDQVLDNQKPKESYRTEVKKVPNKIDFKTENGVKFGSMRSEKGTQGKSILKLRISLDSDLDEEKTKKIEEFFNDLNK